MNANRPNRRFSVDEYIQKIFDQIISENQFDTDIAQLIKKHLGQTKIHSRAGNNLANGLIELAKVRSQEEEK